MCGFAGFCSHQKEEKEIIEKMVATIGHRGPCAQDFYFGKDITLGFCRLSILDLSEAGNQPMQSEDGEVVLVCNGEIYNHLELRKELEARGHRFSSHSDAEVILHGYESYGQAIIHRLRGMFAFVIYDRQKNLLFGGNDLFGIKPFYYTKRGRDFIFASEAKALFCHPSVEKRVNEKALLPYLCFQYVPTEEIAFADVFRLPPAHTFVYQDGNFTLSCYCDRTFSPDNTPDADRILQLRKTMAESVALHRQSDVPIGAFLSGGIDSSYLCALLRPRHTFSVGFCEESRFDETPLATLLAERIGACHHTRILTASECFDALPDIQYHADSPLANPSCVPLWFLAKEASQYVTVVLSGEGADELFGGYDSYLFSQKMRRYRRLPRALRNAIGRFAFAHGADVRNWYLGQAEICSVAEAKHILKKEFHLSPTPKEITAPYFDAMGNACDLTQKQTLDLSLWLPCDILQKADKMTMASSLELRVPYLDRDVFDLALRTRESERVQNECAKAVLRKASREVLTRTEAYRQKKGFPVPIRLWLRKKSFYDRIAEEFASENATLFFDRKAIFALLKDHKEGRTDCQRKIWCIYCFLIWYRRYFQ